MGRDGWGGPVAGLSSRAASGVLPRGKVPAPDCLALSPVHTLSSVTCCSFPCVCVPSVAECADLKIWSLRLPQRCLWQTVPSCGLGREV